MVQEMKYYGTAYGFQQAVKQEYAAINADPNGVEKLEATPENKIKRSSYKTVKGEIYNLIGKTVRVTDMGGKLLRTEDLDPQVHHRFYE